MKISNSIRKSFFATKLFGDNRGVAIIEMAIILPIILVIVFATIEFGNYYLKEMVVQRAVNTVAAYVQTAYPNSTAADGAKINTDVNAMIPTLRAGLFGNGEFRYFCAGAAANRVDAKNGAEAYRRNPKMCPGNWHYVNVARDNTINGGTVVVAPTDQYYIAVGLGVEYKPITSLPALAGIKMPEYVTATAVTAISAALADIPRDANGSPVSCTGNQVVQYDNGSNKYTCVDGLIPPTKDCAVVAYSTQGNKLSCASSSLPTTDCVAVYADRFATPNCQPGFYMKALVKSTDKNWDGYGAVCCNSDPTSNKASYNEARGTAGGSHQVHYPPADGGGSGSVPKPSPSYTSAAITCTTTCDPLPPRSAAGATPRCDTTCSQ